MLQDSKSLFVLHIRSTADQLAALRRLSLAESASAGPCPAQTTSAESDAQGEASCLTPCADHGLGACPEFLPVLSFGECCPLCGLPRAYSLGQLREFAAYLAQLLHRDLPLLEAAVRRGRPAPEALRGAGARLSQIRGALQVAVGWGLVTLGPPSQTLGVARG